MEKNKEKVKYTSIGGQAVIEGIMMRGPKKTCTSVRAEDGKIKQKIEDNSEAKWYNKIPVIRGCINFVTTMIIGYKALNYSAEVAGEEAEATSKFEKWLVKTFGDNLMKIVSGIALVFGFALSAVLFVVLPTYISKFIGSIAFLAPLRTLIEGIVKIAIFLAYISLVALMPDIRRVFMYHGAEHKTIHCYEHKLPLTVENIKKCSRFHPRCGTSFLLIVLVVSIIISSFITWNNTALRITLKLLLLPLVVGISYEIIKLAGRYNNVLTRIISAPGVWFQHITTKEPDEKMIEVAINAMNEVIPENSEEALWK